MYNDFESVCECNICQCHFDIEAEGGIDGFLGVLAFSLCPMCHSGLDMLYTEIHGCNDDGDEEIQ